MKKLTVYLIAFIILFCSNTSLAADTLKVDENKIKIYVETAMNLAQVITKTNPLIPFIPNEITATALTTAIGFIIRFIAKRRLRKKGLLVDKKLADSQATE